jgi:hypothetical protein
VLPVKALEELISVNIIRSKPSELLIGVFIANPLHKVLELYPATLSIFESTIALTLK